MKISDRDALIALLRGGVDIEVVSFCGPAIMRAGPHSKVGRSGQWVVGDVADFPEEASFLDLGEAFIDLGAAVDRFLQLREARLRQWPCPACGGPLSEPHKPGCKFGELS